MIKEKDDLVYKEQGYGDCLLEECEQLGVERFQPLAERYCKVFSHTGQTGEGAFFDIAVEDITGGTSAVENKVRHILHDRYTTTPIEVEKMGNIKSLWTEKGIPTLYVNYFDDGHILAWDMARIFELGFNNGFERKWFDKIKWYDKDGKAYYKSGWRIMLPNRLAIHLDGKLKVVNRKDYDEKIFSRVEISRQTGIFDFDRLDYINDDYLWTIRNR